MSLPPPDADRSNDPENHPSCPPNSQRPTESPQAGESNYPPPTAPSRYPPPATQKAVSSLQSPITTQPVGGMQNPLGSTDGQMAPKQPKHSNCPRGLEHLLTIDFLFVQQKVERFEATFGMETNNRYTIKNNQGEKLYYAFEETDCCTRGCYGSLRGFNIKVVDDRQNQILNFQRDSNCSECCPMFMQVYSGAGEFLGSVEPTPLTLTPQFNIKDETGRIVMKLEGPMFRIGEADFQIFSADKSQLVGKISKVWSGLARELFTDADHFGVRFQKNLDVRMKAVLLGTTFLVDFMYYETSR